MCKHMKQNYELSYLISPRLSDQQAAEVQRLINNALQEKEGVVFDSQFPRKFRLSYSIQKENEAWLQITYFSLEPGQLAGFEKKLKESKEILRFLILKRKPIRASRPTAAVREKSSLAETPEASPKVELEEIEKKLDEILGSNESQ